MSSNTFLSEAFSYYHSYLRFEEEYKDTRIDNFPLMGSPIKIIALTTLYIWFVKSYGPKFMKNRQAFELKTFMLAYNIFQIAANMYMVYLGTTVLISNPNYADWGCMQCDRTATDYTDVRGSYLYYILKVSDYLDTVFMVLRKRNRQITFLHVYHHAIMGLGAYASTRFIGAGHFLMLGYLNCFVHVIMYLYYFLSAYRPELKNSLWWKKHITQLQILQFLVLFVHFVRGLLRKNCVLPVPMVIFTLIQNVLMVSLFTNFYIKTYIWNPIDKKASKVQD